MVQRRTLLKGGVAAAVLAGLAPVRLFGSTPYDPAADGFSKSGFRSLVNSWFHVDDGVWKAVELVEVSDEGSWHAHFDQFSLRFRGLAREEIPAGTYTVVPEQGDAFEVFLQPADGDEFDAFYLACFGVDRPQGTSCA